MLSQEGGAAPLAMSAGAAGDSASLLRFIRQGRSFSGRERHCFFLNTRSDRFADVSSASGLDLDDDGRAVAPVDWDTDGDLDLWIVNRNGPQLRFMQNRLPANSRFVALRLQGTTCNRDAIGAQVKVVANGQQIVRSLRAGDGYLSQTSKWIHIGLGASDQVDEVSIRWPDGGKQSLEGIRVGRRYVVEQGSDAREWTPPRSHVQLADRGAVPPTGAAEVGVFSLSRLPLPQLSYQDQNGRNTNVSVGKGGLALVNLWAGWCGPCLQELAEWTQRQDELRGAGIDIVALSVSGLDPEKNDADSQADMELLEKMNFPFRRGVADAELVETLQVANNHLFDLHLPIPVPTSVLIDHQGYLVGLYKGGVSVDRLLRDASNRNTSDEQQRQLACFGEGRWHEPLNRISMVPMLDELIERGLLAQADSLVRRLTTARKERLLPALVRLGMAFYRQESWQRAKEHFAVVVKIDPSYVGVELALAGQREREGNLDSAAKLYREALRRNPKSVAARNRLAWLLATSQQASLRNGAEAVELAQDAVNMTGRRDAAILDTLAAANAEVGRFTEAISTAELAAQVARSKGQLNLALEIEGHLNRLRNAQPIRARSNDQITRPKL